jgi:CxxC motif-containing protein (DUF1111 family)
LTLSLRMGERALGMLHSVRIAAWGMGAVVGCSQPARVARVDRPDLPLLRATPAELARFQQGDDLFETTFREPDGLGPLFIRRSCAACHRSDARGPGLVAKMAVVEADGVTTATDQSALHFGPTQRPYVTAGAKTPLVAPQANAVVRVTYRLPPAVFGRGYLEAFADEEIERVARAAASRNGRIRGRIHRVHAASSSIGRFGLKARIATLDDFTADALQGDMGITSPLRPREAPNPDGIGDDKKPGLDVESSTVEAIADYMRLLEIPARHDLSPAGRALFEKALCSVCHVPALKTRADHPIRALTGIDAPVYTDLLLHDMGSDLADGVVDVEAGSREWRTAPLVGLRFFGALMHDGRAHSVEEAIVAHGGPGSEAAESVERFNALTRLEREELVRLVSRL